MDNNLIPKLGDALLDMRPFGLAVSRVWTTQGAKDRGIAEAESNPYKFGDLPTTWAESFRRCLEGGLVAEDLIGLPDKDVLASNRFLVRGAQYGSIHISKNVSLFVDGWYSEIEPKLGEQCYSCICVPTELLFEIGDFFEKFNVCEELKIARSGAVSKKIILFQSRRFPGISFTVRFRGIYPEVSLAPTILEYEVGISGNLLPLKFDGKTVAFGEVALPEALTLQVFAAQMVSTPISEISVSSTYVDYILENGQEDCQEYRTHCDDMIYVVNDIISFVFPPQFLESVEPLQSVTPPVAIPTQNLARFMHDQSALAPQ